MDWVSLAAYALVFTIAVVVLRLFWNWLIILIAYGPTTYVGIVAGHFVGVHSDSVGAGLATTLLVSGCLTGAHRVLLGVVISDFQRNG